MDFTPTETELEIINNIHKYNNSDYTIIRLSQTMINKNIIDANIFIRNLLLKYNIVDYSKLENGGSNGKIICSNLILSSSETKIKTKFYKANDRGDARFSIYGINTLVRDKKISSNDLLYFTVSKKNKTPKILIINLTQNIPKEDILSKIFNNDEINSALSRLIPKIKNIAKNGLYKNSKGVGKLKPKDAGDTLEYLLGIKTNNNNEADFEKLIEIKTKTKNNLATLFTLRPNFENTPIAEIESNDKNRVAAFTREYGYTSEKHPNHKSLYITIGTKESPQNQHGFYLDVNENTSCVEILKKTSNKVLAFWEFKELETTLYKKHPATLWVTAETDTTSDIVKFRYTKAELTRTPQFMTFITLIKRGIITYDWRGYTTTTGKYSGKNHGNAWRIKDKHIKDLFGDSEEIKLLD